MCDTEEAVVASACELAELQDARKLHAGTVAPQMVWEKLGVNKAVLQACFILDYYGIQHFLDGRALSGLRSNPLFNACHPAKALRLYKGESPAQISGGLLNHSQAHEWFLGGMEVSASEFLAAEIGIPTTLGYKIRGGRTTYLWVSKKWDNPVMRKDRVVHGPGGMTKEFTYLCILDEIRDEDITSLADSPDRVFERASKRMEALYLAEMGESVQLPKCPLSGNEEVWQLLGSQDLLAEGKRLHHCVGGYVTSCIREVSYIYSTGDSTVEVMYRDGAWVICQHFADRNSQPTDQQKEKVARWFKWATSRRL
jgi:hypothetical protein